MPMLSFETIANIVAIAIMVVLGIIYIYGKRHFEATPDDDHRPKP